MEVTNHNGHGVMHKAAQRGWEVGCRWFVDKILLGIKSHPMSTDKATTALRLVGPDTEGEFFGFRHVMSFNIISKCFFLLCKGYCPSDLAGMEGNEELARFLVGVELDTIERVVVVIRNLSLPEWLDGLKIGTRVSEKEQFIWEPHGGIRRMRWKLFTAMKSIEANKE